MKLEVQSKPECQGTTSLTGQPRFPTPCVENRRWTFKHVTYATLNVQGTCNNLCSSGAGDPGGDVDEYDAREAANEQWLQDTFDEADDNHSAAVMIIWLRRLRLPAKRDPKTLVRTDGTPTATTTS